VTVTIEVPFGFEKPNLAMGNVEQDKTVSKIAYLLAKDPSDLSVKELSTSSEFIKAKVLDHSDSDMKEGKIAIEVTLLPGLSIGRINQTVKVTPNNEALSEATLRIAGKIIGDVEVSPESIRFLIMTKANNSLMPDSHKVKIVNRSDTRILSVTDIHDPDDRMEFDLVSFSTVQEGRVFELIVRPKDVSNITTAVSGSFMITTDHPEQKEMKVRYALTPQG